MNACMMYLFYCYVLRIPNHGMVVLQKFVRDDDDVDVYKFFFSLSIIEWMVWIFKKKKTIFLTWTMTLIKTFYESKVQKKPHLEWMIADVLMSAKVENTS